MDQQKKLFVGKLPWSVTDRELGELFAQAGTVVSARVIMERETGRSKGFGFVEMSTVEEAQKAVQMFNNYQWEKQTIVVNEARPETEDRRGGGGGGGGGYNRGGGGDRNKSWGKRY